MAKTYQEQIDEILKQEEQKKDPNASSAINSILGRQSGTINSASTGAINSILNRPSGVTNPNASFAINSILNRPSGVTNPNLKSQIDSLLSGNGLQKPDPQPDPEPETNVPLTPEELYRRKQALLQQQLQEQQAYAQNATARGQARLEQQLADARKSYISGLQTANEQGFSRGRNLLNQLSGRGLATSGLMQLGDIQSRMATGKTLSALGNQLNQAQLGAYDAQRGMEDSLQQALLQASQQYRAGNLEADEQLYGRQQAMAELIAEAQTNLIQLSKDPNVTAEDLQKMSQIYSDRIASAGGQTGAVATPSPSLEAQLAQTGDLGASTKFNQLSAPPWLQTIMDFIPGVGGASRMTGITSKNSDGTIGVSYPYTYNIPGRGSINFKTREEAVTEIKRLYQGMPGYSNIEIKANAGGNIRFYVGTADFKTYNQALEYYNRTKTAK